MSFEKHRRDSNGVGVIQQNNLWLSYPMLKTRGVMRCGRSGLNSIVHIQDMLLWEVIRMNSSVPFQNNTNQKVQAVQKSNTVNPEVSTATTKVNTVRNAEQPGVKTTEIEQEAQQRPEKIRRCYLKRQMCAIKWCWFDWSDMAEKRFIRQTSSHGILRF
ncbi:hypothetical protein Tco_0189279 [Tanacetum coccineum]